MYVDNNFSNTTNWIECKSHVHRQTILVYYNHIRESQSEVNNLIMGFKSIIYFRTSS